MWYTPHKTTPRVCLEKIKYKSEVHNGKSHQVSFSHSPGMYESEKELLGLLPVNE
ncbi:hypothetical protein OIU84_017664 [Salix udensis]|uniref:Uncharacterized protein n=1 Tax=Salix udensis TaxID=889485 RepID=A0AAD6PL86_9ROSI|nr:hypothetical protein OIU84_017664 [Salix udensis]